MGAKGEPGTPGKPGRTVRGWGGCAGASPMRVAELGSPGDAANPHTGAPAPAETLPQRDFSSNPAPVPGVGESSVGTSQHPYRGVSFSFGILGLSRTSWSPRAERSQRRKGTTSSVLPGGTEGEAQSGGVQAMVPGEKPPPGAGQPLLGIAPGSDVPVLVTKTSPSSSLLSPGRCGARGARRGPWRSWQEGKGVLVLAESWADGEGDAGGGGGAFTVL